MARQYRKSTKRRRIGGRRRKYGGVRRQRRLRRATKKITSSRVGTSVRDETWVKMRYNYLWNFNSSVNFNNLYQFRGNSLYDPDYTGGGRQPMSYDQWTNFYSRYYVAAAKIAIRVINLSTTDPLRVTIVPTNYDTVDMSSTDVSTLPYAVSKLVGTRDGYGVAKSKSYTTTQKISGRRGTEYEANYSGIMGGSGVGSNPVLVWYWNVIAENFNGASVLNYSIQVKITYYSKLMQRVVLGNS